MNTVTEVKFNVLAENILEPLCNATEQIFKPLNLLEHDYLYVGIDVDCKRFITSVVAARKSNELDPVEKLFGKDNDYVMMKGYLPSFNSTRWIHKVPEKVKVDNSATIWKMGGTDYTALVMHYCWNDRIIFKTEEAYVFYKYLIHRFMSQTIKSHIAADYKVHGKVPELPKEYVEHDELPLSSYQKVALSCSLFTESYALFMEQGTGKTPIVVNRINLEGTLKRLGKIPGQKKAMYRALILCPKSIRRNWCEEFVRFSVAPGKVVALRGGLMRRQKCLIDGVRPDENCVWSACICSIDSIATITEVIKKIPWDLVVIDESHFIKSSNSLRFKTCKIFQEVNVKSRMILTGTPIANTMMDLFAQLEFLGEGMSGFMSFKNFRSFHGKYTSSSGGNSVGKLIGLKGIPLIKERLARNSFMIRKSETGLELPDKVYDIREVEMTPKQLEFYNTLSNELVITIEKILEENTGKITADHILTMMLRLAQITSGHIKLDNEYDPTTGDIIEAGDVIQIGDVNPKVVEIINMLEDEGRDHNGKTIIWAAFIEDVRVVSEHLAKRGINHVGYHRCVKDEYRVKGSDEAEKVFNCERDCRVLVANPASGGIGLNFLGYDRTNPDDYETYTDHEIFMSCNWSAVHRIQAEDRAHRRGTRSNVRITDLVVPGTIDEEIRARVLNKQKMAMSIQDVRDILVRLTKRNN